MKPTIILIVFFALASCERPKTSASKAVRADKYGTLKVFVLKDPSEHKYFLSDSVKAIFKNGYIGESPVIAIDGIVFNYQQNLDTIILPLKKNEITTVSFLNKKSSSVIYGANAISGAVIINTIALQNSRNTLRDPSEKKK